MGRAGSGDDTANPAAAPGHHAAIRPWSQLTLIIRHIAELLQYNRVRKLANVRIACTLECDRPPLAESLDIPSARLIAAASL
jgi:hypothetical protein